MAPDCFTVAEQIDHHLYSIDKLYSHTPNILTLNRCATKVVSVPFYKIYVLCSYKFYLNSARSLLCIFRGRQYGL